MLKILLVDHAFHRETDSSRFFAEMLATRFSVEHLYVAPDARFGIDWETVAENDIVVLWQLDYLAPLFLARGHRTVVAPMYDGSAALPLVHWMASGGARFLNFSRTLHERVRLLGLDTRLVKFFPEPVAAESLPSFDTLRGFLWQRRPEQGINAGMVARLFGDQLHSLHIHNAPDDPSMIRRFAPPAMIGLAPVSASEWSDSRDDYHRLLEACNVFICPRPAEGIGIAMLEAMARGMLVVSNDMPVHNEYICNWVNGVLFNTAAIGEANFGRAGDIARMGWHSVREGRRRWLASTDTTLDFIAGAPRYRVGDAKLVKLLDRDLVPAYLEGGEVYERLLLRALPALLQRSPATDADLPLPAQLTYAMPRHVPVAVTAERVANTRVVSIPFANGAARPLLKGGWSWDEDFGVWIEGRRASLCFAVDIDFPVAALAVEVRALASALATGYTVLRIGVNDVPAQHRFMVPGNAVAGTSYLITPDVPFTGSTWKMEFTCNEAHDSPADRRQLSVAILDLRITFLPQAIAVPQAAALVEAIQEAPAGACLVASAPRPKLKRVRARTGKDTTPSRPRAAVASLQA